MKILSVAIPAYNVEKYIQRCLITFIEESIMNDLEVIIVNDGSTDRTPEIVLEYTNKYPETFKLVNKKNGGHGSAVNTGIQYSTGKYFRVVDGDDWVDTDDLVELIQSLKKTDVDAVSMHYHRVNMITGARDEVRENNVQFGKVYRFKDLKIEDRYFTLASTCFKTSILKELNYKFQENTYFVDVEYIIMPIVKINTVMFLDLYVYKYFVGNENQSISLKNLVRRYDHHDRVVKSCIRYINTVNTDEVHKKYMYNIIKKVLFTHYSIALVYNEDKEQGAIDAKEFDEFLRKESPYLYEETNKEFGYIRDLRKYEFDHKKYENAFPIKCKALAYRFKNQLLRVRKILGKIKRLIFRILNI